MKRVSNFMRSPKLVYILFLNKKRYDGLQIEFKPSSPHGTYFLESCLKNCFVLELNLTMMFLFTTMYRYF